MPGALKKSPLKRLGTTSRGTRIHKLHKAERLLSERPYIALGLEGSANKLGAGIIKHDSGGSTTVLSNVRHTYITPPGEGFLPQDTAKHHRQWIHSVIKDSLKQAGVGIPDLDCICFTKGASQNVWATPCEAHVVRRAWNGCTPPVSGFSSQNTRLDVQ